MTQYDFAKIATSLAGFPVRKHAFISSGCSKGKHRIVAPVSSLIFSSSWSLFQQDRDDVE